MMEMRKLEITIASADNLPKARWHGLGRMKVYAVVMFDGKSSWTKVDMEGDRNPRWDQTFEYLIDESCAQKPGSIIVVKLYCRRRWRNRDKVIGDDLRLQVKDLFDMGVRSENSYSLPETEGGTLRISFRFGDVYVKKEKKPSAWKKYLSCGFMGCVSILLNVVGLWI